MRNRKQGSDYVLGLLLLLITICTYVTFYNEQFNWSNAFPDGLGKLRAIQSVLYICFGHIIGAVTGVIVALWLIFRK